MRWPKVASTTTVTSVSGNSSQERAHRFVELVEARKGPSFRCDVRSVDDDVTEGWSTMSTVQSTTCLRTRSGDRAAHGSACVPTTRTLDDVPELVDDVTDLLQHLIRNACVNDGSVDVGT